MKPMAIKCYDTGAFVLRATMTANYKGGYDNDTNRTRVNASRPFVRSRLLSA